MKTLKQGGTQELGHFKNRIGRAYGRGEIDKETFEKLSTKTERMIEELSQLPDFEKEDDTNAES